jgi:hypothetical protein
MRAHKLHAAHERPGNEGSPQLRRAKLGTGDRVGCNTRWIVISRSRDETRAEDREETAKFTFAFGHIV